MLGMPLEALQRLRKDEMEAPGRVELPTNGLGNRCSIHLSYGAAGTLLDYLTSV